MATKTAVRPKRKKCPRCTKTFPVSNFYKDSRRANGLSRYCKSCHCKVSYESRKKKYQTADEKREYSRKYFMAHKYGITVEQYDAMFKAQKGLCAICKRPETETWKGRVKALAVDHCHDTGKVRGLLCSMCNGGIGRLGDSVERVRAALGYLIAYSE